MNLEITYNESWLRYVDSEIPPGGDLDGDGEVYTQDKIKKEFHDLEQWRKNSEDDKRELKERSSEEDWYPHFDVFNRLELDFLNMWKDKIIKIDEYQNHLEVVEEINFLLPKEYPRNTTHLNELTDNIIKDKIIEDQLRAKRQKETNEFNEILKKYGVDQNNLN
tara:strand:- start:312 stop:803 length:492 start_codon:yes stop_codon:yes gene_type:complete